jgi:hypothetical protein
MATINTDQNYPNVQLSITNAKGQPAKVDGVPVWATSDATQLTVTPSADGMNAVIDTVGPSPVAADGTVTTARITVSADADLGAGVNTITGVSEDVTVTVGPLSIASVIKLDLGTPTAKP